MTKVLRASTIVDARLYVHRDADRQLRRGLEDMGRPSYVLVARQMGKTNLLLNARRELQTEADHFVYVDLSNPPSTVREHFRGIVDSALDSSDQRFAATTKAIEQIRGRNLAPHKEHELELRQLLNDISGKLVIILDEIDALTTSPFSDQVFSHIRSIYFSRVTISAYSRLTYILSGVAEPAELIKNPKLSPFNIGEKIYLDDFSVDEFEIFLSKTGLPFSDDVSSAIYGWLKGNPRMTWDVCSELEDHILRGLTVSPQAVDEVIQKLYLTSFDRAPVDHIRTLTESSPALRRALVELRYGKGATISDSARAQLYLAGIVGSRGSELRIKNRVIDETLSEQWLRDVERKQLGLRGMANEHLAQSRYREALELFKECLQSAELNAAEREDVLDGMSAAHFGLDQYEEALACIERGSLDRSQGSLYWLQRSRQGMCLFRLQRYAQAIPYFKETADGEGDEDRRRLARLNLAGAYLEADATEHHDEILSIYHAVLSEVESIGPSRPSLKGTEVAARFNLAIALERFDDKDGAREQLRRATASASRLELALLNARLLTLEESEENRRECLNTAVDILVEDRLLPSGTPRDSLGGVSDATFERLLIGAFGLRARDAFDKLMKYCAGWTSAVAAGGALMVKVVRAVSLRGDDASLDRMRDWIVGFTDAVGEDSRYEIAKWMAYYASARRTIGPHVAGYMELFNSRARTLDRMDMVILSRILSGPLSDGRIEAATDLLKALEQHRESTPPEVLVVFDYFAMVNASVAQDEGEERRLAHQILSSNAEGRVSEILGEEDWKTISGAAREVVRNASPRVPVVRQGPKYGRNEWVTVRYENGQTKRVKFKNAEGDLRAGICRIVSN